MKLHVTFYICAIVFSLFICSFITGCDNASEEEKSTNWIHDSFASMTPDQKIGQVFCISVDPIRYFITPDYKRTINALIRKYKPGAIYLSTILEDWEHDTLNEFNANKLLAEIIKMQSLQEIPLLIGANFENGAWFWDQKATRFSLPMALGTMRSAGMAYRQGKITAIEAQAQGIHWIIAPVLNTSDFFSDNFKSGSFGNNIENITELGKSFINGCQDIGVAACLKYFPADTMLLSQDPSMDYEFLVPFKGGIDAGVMTVMTSPLILSEEHIHNPESESVKPVKEILREKLGFNGIVASMVSVNADSSFLAEEEKISLMNGLDSGYNIFILPETTDMEIPVIDLLVNEAEEDRLDLTSIESSVMRILTLKDTIDLHSFEAQVQNTGIAKIGLSEYHLTAEKISDESVTMIKNDGDILPLDTTKQQILSLCFTDKNSLIEAAFYDSKLKEYENIIHMNIIGNPNRTTEMEILRQVKEADVLLCTFFIKPIKTETMLEEKAQKLLRRILKLNNNSAAVSFFNPYLINQFPDIKGFFVTYSSTEHSMDVAIDTIFGKHKPKGKLPTDISEYYQEGHGLHY